MPWHHNLARQETNPIKLDRRYSDGLLSNQDLPNNRFARWPLAMTSGVGRRLVGNDEQGASRTRAIADT